jgi:hypothetical protein
MNATKRNDCGRCGQSHAVPAPKGLRDLDDLFQAQSILSGRSLRINCRRRFELREIEREKTMQDDGGDVQ